MGFRDAVAHLAGRYGVPIDTRPDPRWERARLAAERLESWRRERLEHVKRHLSDAYRANNHAYRWLVTHPAADWSDLHLQVALLIQSRTEGEIWRLQTEREKLETADAETLLAMLKEAA